MWINVNVILFIYDKTSDTLLSFPRAFSVRAIFRGRKMALARALRSSLGSRRWPSHCQLIRNVNETKRQMGNAVRSSIADGPYTTATMVDHAMACPIDMPIVHGSSRSMDDGLLCARDRYNVCTIVFCLTKIRCWRCFCLYMLDYIDRSWKWCFILGNNRWSYDANLFKTILHSGNDFRFEVEPMFNYLMSF